MKKPVLKSCPFCGELGKLVTWYIPTSEPLYKVNCQNQNCNIRPSTEYNPNQNTVITLWNKRGVPLRNICASCKNSEWDMPQCKDCNAGNGFRWHEKEKTDAQV